MPVEVVTQDVNSRDSTAALLFPWVVSLEKLSQGQVNWRGDRSSVHVSLLNNCPFPRHTWQQVVERGGQTASLELLVVSDAKEAKASHWASTPTAGDGSSFVKLYKTPSNCSWLRGMNL